MHLITGYWPDIQDPCEYDMHVILQKILFLERDNFMVLDSTSTAKGYLQARPDTEDTFRVEYRDNAEKRHYKRNTVPPEMTYSLFRSFRQQDGWWRTALMWQDISECFEDLRRAPGPPRFLIQHLKRNTGILGGAARYAEDDYERR